MGAKVAAITRHAMVPIICIGEQDRVGPEAALAVVLPDLDRATSRLAASDPPEVVVAYEPSWAIGQGMAAAPPEVTAEVHQGIHEWLWQRGFRTSQVRVIYGGSVDTTVAEALLRQPGGDGLFVGRAGLDPHRFAAIARTPLPVRAPATS